MASVEGSINDKAETQEAQRSAASEKSVSQSQLLEVFAQLSAGLSSQGVYYVDGVLSDDDKNAIFEFVDDVTSMTIESPSPVETLSKMAAFQLSTLRIPLFPNLAHLVFKDGAENHDILPLLVTPSLKTFRIRSVPEARRLDLSCFFSTLVATAVGLEEVNCNGPSLLSTSLKHIPTLSSLRTLKLTDTGLIFKPDFFYDIGQLPHLEVFVLDTRRAGAVPVVQTPAFREGCHHPALVPCPLNCGVAENDQIQLEDGKATPVPTEDDPILEPVVQDSTPVLDPGTLPRSSFPALKTLSVIATIFELYPLLDAIAADTSLSLLEKVEITFIYPTFEETHLETPPPVVVETQRPQGRKKPARRHIPVVLAAPPPPAENKKHLYHWDAQLPPLGTTLERFFQTKILGALQSVTLIAAATLGSSLTLSLPMPALRALLDLESPTQIVISGAWKGEPSLSGLNARSPESGPLRLKTLSLPPTWPISFPALVALGKRYPHLTDITCSSCGFDDIPAFKTTGWAPTETSGLQVLHPLVPHISLSSLASSMWNRERSLSLALFLYKHFPAVKVRPKDLSGVWQEIDDFVTLCRLAAEAPR